MSFSLYRMPVLIRYGNFIFRYRNKVFPVALAIMVLAFPRLFPDDWLPLDELWETDPWLDMVALSVALAGETLRILTVGLEYIKRGGLNKRIHAERLVTNGLFAHCRNPLYTGNLMICLALLSLADRVDIFAIGGLLAVITYIAIVAAEESFLRAKFGAEYEAYCRTTNRWLPSPRGLAGTIGSMHFNWRRVLLKESSSFYGWLAVAVILDGIEGDFSIARGDFQMFAILFAVGTIVFLTIRVLKRLRWLQL
ncbi:MAG: isoprenylcysteine carboxylmethyltransferase family protein [Alphaproteobacteria bacterium]